MSRRNPARERHRCLEILDISDGATDEEIKKAYRKLALRYHPDKNDSNDAKEKFQEISYAYKYLTEGPEAVGLGNDQGGGGGRGGEHEIPVEVLIRLFPWLIGDLGFPRGPFGGGIFGHSSPFVHIHDPFEDHFGCGHSPFNVHFMDSGFPFFFEDEDAFFIPPTRHRPHVHRHGCHHRHSHNHNSTSFGGNEYVFPHTRPARSHNSNSNSRASNSKSGFSNSTKTTYESSTPSYGQNVSANFSNADSETTQKTTKKKKKKKKAAKPPSAASFTEDIEQEVENHDKDTLEQEMAGTSFSEPIEISDDEPSSSVSNSQEPEKVEKPKRLNKKERRKLMREQMRQEKAKSGSSMQEEDYAGNLDLDEDNDENFNDDFDDSISVSTDQNNDIVSDNNKKSRRARKNERKKQRGNSEYHDYQEPVPEDVPDKYKEYIPRSSEEELEMLRLALEISEAEAASQKKENESNNSGSNNGKKKESISRKNSDGFNVKVSADYRTKNESTGYVPKSSSHGNQGDYRQYYQPKESVRGMYKNSYADNRENDMKEDADEKDDDWDTKSWYDNIGQPSDFRASPMPKLQKSYFKNGSKKMSDDSDYYDNSFYFGNVESKNDSGKYSGNAGMENDNSFDLDDLDDLDDVPLNFDGSGRKGANNAFSGSRNSDLDLSDILHEGSLNVPRGIRAEQMKNIYRRH